VTEVKDGGIEVRSSTGHRPAFIRAPTSPRPRRAAPRALLQGRREGRRPRHPVDKKTRKIQVSIKALEIAEEKEAVAQYGSSDSGASLGDILGAALKAVTVLSIPSLSENATIWLPAVVVTSFILSAPLAWYIAPRMRSRAYKATH
jgi:hypothetical protein